MDVNSNFALFAAMNQNGVHPKVSIFDTGYEDTLPGSDVWQTAQGVFFGTTFRPWNVSMNAGTTEEKATLTKYGKFKSTAFPDFGQSESYLGADLMIQGLLKAGANPTSASTIKALRSSSYNGNGILPMTLNYATNFGYNTNQQCLWYEVAGSQPSPPPRRTRPAPPTSQAAPR